MNCALLSFSQSPGTGEYLAAIGLPSCVGGDSCTWTLPNKNGVGPKETEKIASVKVL
jgi:hypothetical protein